MGYLGYVTGCCKFCHCVGVVFTIVCKVRLPHPSHGWGVVAHGEDEGLWRYGFVDDVDTYTDYGAKEFEEVDLGASAEVIGYSPAPSSA